MRGEATWREPWGALARERMGLPEVEAESIIAEERIARKRERIDVAEVEPESRCTE